jgi:hypothetical protein
MHIPRQTLRTFTRAAAIAAFGALAPVATAAAQTIYPTFQTPRTVSREYNFAVADADVLTALVFQWREGWSPTSQLSFDVGMADLEGDGDVQLLVGGAYGRQLSRASNELPLDALLTVGANAMIGDLTVFEIPVGVSLGHRFPLEQGLALTPYLHPRVALSYCGDCVDESDLGVAFDLGLDFEVSPRLSVRGVLTFGSDDSDAIGIGLAWRPQGLRR